MKIKKIKKIVKDIFIKNNLSLNDAEISSKAIINAELVGAYGHGLSRLKCTVIGYKKK